MVTIAISREKRKRDKTMAPASHCKCITQHIKHISPRQRMVRNGSKRRQSVFSSFSKKNCLPILAIDLTVFGPPEGSKIAEMPKYRVYTRRTTLNRHSPSMKCVGTRYRSIDLKNDFSHPRFALSPNVVDLTVLDPQRGQIGQKFQNIFFRAAQHP